MILVAQARNFTGRNNITLVNNDFMEYDFKDYYDIIIFSYVLHHMDNPIEALKKAKDMLTERGKYYFQYLVKHIYQKFFVMIKRLEDLVLKKWII